MKKFYFIIVWCSFFFFSSGSFAQTAINPATGGGFDAAGNTFAANGWTVVNSPGGNKWVVGSTTYNSSPNSAYISIDGNPSHYSYDNSTKHISHFYQQVTLPVNAFNVVISFQLKGNLQNDDDFNVIDGLVVYADPSLTAPVADALPGSSAVMVLPQFGANGIYSAQTTTIDFLKGKTFFLIFTWVNNDDHIGDGPPASVDDASLTYCLSSADFTVTGGGAFCTSNPGPDVGLDGSSIGIGYQLYNNGTPVGDPVDGTGSAINFGSQNLVGNYTIIGTSNCNFGVNTYPMDGSVDVTENPLPTAAAGSNAPLCLGSALNLTSGAGVSYTYSWAGPNGFTSIVQNPSIPDFTLAASGTYTVTVTDNGCSATATTDVAVSGGDAEGGTLTSLAICSGESGSLTLSGNSNTPSGWEYSTDSTSVSWTSITNTTTTQAFNNIIVPTFYRALVGDGCGIVYSSIATVSIHNYWTGADISNPTDWQTAGNWSDNQIPATSCPNVYIPNTTNKPVLSTGTGAIMNLYIDAGAILTVNGTGVLKIAGIINNSGTFDASEGEIELNGITAQTLGPNTFLNNAVKDLKISNSTGVTLNNDLDVYGSLTFASGNALIKTNGLLTMKSNIDNTAWVGKMTSGQMINGYVTVERYIDVGVGHGKSWQFLATPTQGQTVLESWMEGGSIAPTGYGTLIIGPGGTAKGFDNYPTNLPSLKYYDPGTDNWIGIDNTGLPVYNQKGYMLFVRGDRSKSFPQVGNTTLRTKGTLFTPNNPPPSTVVKSDSAESVGNPYASAIDLRNIGLGGGAARSFIVWDPALGGAYGLGAYQTLVQTKLINSDYNFYPSPGGGSYGTVNTPNNYIQSGQAFFVQATGSDGTIAFDENVKAGTDSYKNVIRQGAVTGSTSGVLQLRANLYGVKADANTFLTDGNLIQFNESYSNKIDKLDARKMVNSVENLAIKSGGKYLAIERRHGIVESDTIFYNLTGVITQNYQLELIVSGLTAYGMQGYVEDTYLGTQTPLKMDGVTKVNFAVTSTAGSKAANRFRIIFRQAPMIALPVTFMLVNAYQKESDVVVEWKVENEKDMQQYEVERSTDGIHFSKVAVEAAINNRTEQSYQWADNNVNCGYNYYRIKSVDKKGKIEYSTVVKVLISDGASSIMVYPNPVTDGIIHLQLKNQPQGLYRVRLLNPSGQLITGKQTGHGGGNGAIDLKWDYSLAHGIYQLEVTRPDRKVELIKVMY